MFKTNWVKMMSVVVEIDGDRKSASDVSFHLRQVGKLIVKNTNAAKFVEHKFHSN